MTLSTYVLIGAPVDPKEVFDFLRPLVNTPEGTEVKEGTYDLEGTPLRDRTGECYRDNPCGVGADAWLLTNYRSDGNPICRPVDVDDDEEYVAEQAKDPRHTGFGYIEINFDTAYGYRNDRGENCSELHGRLIRELIEHLGPDVPVKWRNEYTGEWHDGTESLENFGGYHTSGGAESWFQNIARPAIERDILRTELERINQQATPQESRDIERLLEDLGLSEAPQEHEDISRQLRDQAGRRSAEEGRS